jgi:hypothetical protein
MVFMGEEWAASHAWQFFTIVRRAELADAVRRGRRAEFAEHGWAEDDDVPDPQDPATRTAASSTGPSSRSRPMLGCCAGMRLSSPSGGGTPTSGDDRLDAVSVEDGDGDDWL